MVGSFTNRFSAATGSEIYAMHAKASDERLLSKTEDVTGIRRTLQPMKDYDLPERLDLRLML